jgi:hypothetical protein
VHGHTAAVIAAVFEPFQALYQDGNDVALTDGADDATHVVELLAQPRPWLIGRMLGGLLDKLLAKYV